ncbi:hypothetical protein CLV24_112101 [Pontibacter ummariensis]|uniref:Outer membrane protein beta-barrel domain-containing protein n=1 Tax=Pontibacter ummariensis TaxID=1610492 RepID=A0A239GYC5_9BACT|nr:hypothetical protein [Pontibacter ummariensis]PRY10974.1 hypothetical protein CLV24_112101 [Pontibacter ummariensis]SNS73921.1 hypothetical protein SAMN06296052_11277 [Pontibacter ummariensis]
MIHKSYLVHACWLALLMLSFVPSFGQQDEAPFVPQRAYTHVIKLHPLQLGEVYLSYEKMRTEHISHEFGFSYVYSSYVKGDDYIPDNVKVSGLHVRMSQRCYTSKKHGPVPLGFFHGPLFGYQLLAYDEHVFGEAEQAPNQRELGRMYLNALELNYQAGGQFKLNQHLTMELAMALGGRLKYVRAENADKLLTTYTIGHALIAEKNSAMFLVPSPQLNISLGYSF